MFGSLLCKVGVTSKRTDFIINGESFSSSLAPPAKYLLFTLQNLNVLIPNSRVTSIFYSFSTTTTTTSNVNSGSDSAFVVSYLINSCGLSENQAITASKKLSFKTTIKPDSILTLLRTYGFNETHISKLISRDPYILSLKPYKTLKPKLDFFKSKGFFQTDFPDFISRLPKLRARGLEKEIIPSFDMLRSVVQSDENVIQIIKRNSWVISIDQAKRVMANIERLRKEGVPETIIRKYLIQQPRAYTVNRFKENLEMVKAMGFNHLQTTFLMAVHILASMTEVNWRKKVDLYKRWGWSEGQIHSAFRRGPACMKASEKKITAVMNFLVNEMGYDSSSVADSPMVFSYSLKDRIIPRCSVIRVLISRGLIKENIYPSKLATLVDESFQEKFVKKFEHEVPGLIKVFKGQLNYQELLQK